MSTNMISDQLSEQLLKAATIVESQLDQQLEAIDKLDDDDLEQIRRQRVDEIKRAHAQKQEWLASGHGEYDELADERAFFDASKRSTKLVCHFYRPTTERCRIIDKHLRLLAAKHLSTRFVHINAEKVPYLTKRLNIRVLPTIAIVDAGQTIDYVRGFDELGGVDDFTTATLETRLAASGVIPATASNKNRSATRTKTTTIRGKAIADDDSD